MREELNACSYNTREVTLSGFTFMDKEPDDFEVCIVIEKSGHLSAGCWSESGAVFRQARGGAIDSAQVLAWFPIEKASIDVNNFNWNPTICLIAEFYGVKVWAPVKKDSIITLVYTGGNEEELVIHMDIISGKIIENEEDFEDLKYIKATLMDWYVTYRENLIEGYQSGKYYRLPNYED